MRYTDTEAEAAYDRIASRPKARTGQTVRVYRCQSSSGRRCVLARVVRDPRLGVLVRLEHTKRVLPLADLGNEITVSCQHTQQRLTKARIEADLTPSTRPGQSPG